jgi:hypothetical protein
MNAARNGSRVEAAARSRRAAFASPNQGSAPAGNVSVIAAELTVARCRWCNDDLEHCHDSFVTHATGERHCMDAGCQLHAEAHHLVVPCDDVGCTCATAFEMGAANTA